MTVLEPFGAAVMILQESVKLLPKNVKLIALTIVPTLLFSSLFFLIFNFSYKSLLRDMLLRESFIPLTSANSAEFSSILAGLKEDFGLMLLVNFAFILAYYIISLLSIIATILVSAISHSGRTLLSTRDFILLVLRSWKRPLITGFFTTLLDVGYVFLVLFVASPFMVYFGKTMGDALAALFVVAIVGYIFYMYLSTVWILGIVISVIEENSYGIEVLGKAWELIQGRRIQGFILNTIFALLSAVLFQGFRIIRGHKWIVNDIIFGLFVVNFSCLLRLFLFMGYTVLYFQCKKSHGEEIELQGDEYTKISSTAVLDDMP